MTFLILDIKELVKLNMPEVIHEIFILWDMVWKGFEIKHWKLRY